MQINFFSNIYQKQPESTTSILEFLNKVKSGTWKTLIDPINAETDKKKRGKLKHDTLPYVLISGTFEKRAAAALIKHSGFICLDIDEIEDLDGDWDKVINDPYTYGAFKSASGRGIAVLVQINGNKHKQSFESLETYYLENYQITLDEKCSDVSRARFVSYDPNTFVNQNAEVFKKLIKVKKEKAKPEKYNFNNVITGKNDIEHVITQAKEQRIDLSAGDYKKWVSIGFALNSEFGEGGRDYFHAISSLGQGYETKKCDVQYTKCVKSDGKGINIGTFFTYAKEYNLSLTTPKTQTILTYAIQQKQVNKISEEDVKEGVNKLFGFKDAESDEIIKKVYESNNDLKLAKDLPLIGQIKIFLQGGYNIKKNEVTGRLENNGAVMNDTEINSIYIKACEIVSDKIQKDLIRNIIDSDFTEVYNPLKDYIERNRTKKPTGLIEKLANSIESDTGREDPKNINPNYKSYFLKKWLVGVVSGIYGEHSPLLLVLAGGQNTGKTEFFRRLLPKELKKYYGESKLDAGKDDELLMTQKLMLMDDELGGKSKKDHARLKELTSKETFSIRKPYARDNEDFKRLASLCGTTNEMEFISDSTGNRRLIPIDVISINHGLYNSIDKDDLFIEIFHLYNGGFKSDLTTEDVETLNSCSGQFEQQNETAGLIEEVFKKPEFKNSNQNVVELTATKIAIEIEKVTNKKAYKVPVGKELNSLGFDFETKKVNGNRVKLYKVVYIAPGDNEAQIYSKEEEEDNDPLPF
jgi:predicted P-loop ATPase